MIDLDRNIGVIALIIWLASIPVTSLLIYLSNKIYNFILDYRANRAAYRLFNRKLNKPVSEEEFKKWEEELTSVEEMLRKRGRL